MGVAKSLCLTCPAYRQPMLRADLARYIDMVEERYENNNLQDLKTKSLEGIVRLIEQPGSQALPYGDVAGRLAMHDAVSDRASQSLLVVSTEETFRQALVQTFGGIETKAGVTQITQTLKKDLNSRASDAAFDWVLCPGSTPASPATGPPPAGPQQPRPRFLTPGLQDPELPATTATPADASRPHPPARRLIMLRELESIGDTHLMAASVQLTHLLLTPITLTPQMIRRRFGIATVDESVWAPLFSSSVDCTYLDTSTVPPQWAVTLASTRLPNREVQRRL